MVCKYVNSKGKTYYLHRKGKLLFFSRRKENAVDLPDGYKIVENTRTGLPILKKK